MDPSFRLIPYRDRAISHCYSSVASIPTRAVGRIRTITLVLGLLIWADMPWSGLWFLGSALGIALLLRSWSSVMFALAVRGIARNISLRPAV